MRRKLGFIWKTYAQPAISIIGMPPVPPGLCPKQSPRKPALFFVQFEDAYVSTFQLPDLH